MNEKSKWKQNAPLVIAHRGASAYAPENTEAAFRAAMDLKADALELDAKLLKDGTVVVFHDLTLDRTTNATGSIFHFSYSEIRNLDAGSHFSEQFSNERIPTLNTVFESFGRSILINVELTDYTRPWDRLPFEVIQLVRQYRLESEVLLSSFNPWALIVAKRLDTRIPRALLVHPGEAGIIRKLFKNIVDPMAYHPHHSLVSNKMMLEARKNKKRVNVWTVNDRERIVKLLKLGVDGLITDCPDTAQEVIGEAERNSSDAE
jgi:glycerophosphoryl diester phosphodiesterase